MTIDADTGRPFFDEVIAFADRLPGQDSTVIVIELENGATLPVTYHHLVYVKLAEDTRDPVMKDVIHAGTVQPGDRLFAVDGPTETSNDNVPSTLVRLVKVTGVSTRNITSGLYAPLTRSGNIVVNDIVASCYAIATNQRVAHWSLWPLRVWYEVCKHDYLELFTEACSQNGYGIHPYIHHLMNVVDYLGITGY